MLGFRLILLCVFISDNLDGMQEKFSFEDLEQSYELGMKLYSSKSYYDAILIFEKILKSNWESSELYYNLGNAYYRTNDISGSVWAYEMCLYNDPLHEDAKFNLKLANINVKDRIKLPEIPAFFQFYLSIKESFTPNKWLKISLLSLCLLSIINLIKNALKKSKSIIFFRNILILFTLVNSMFTIHAVSSDIGFSSGIIYSDSLNILSEPSEGSKILFKVNKGLKVNIIQVYSDWLKIELTDGNIGWLSSKNIRKIH